MKRSIAAMKILQVLLPAALLLSSCSGQPIKTREDLYGTWQLSKTRVSGEVHYDRNDPGVLTQRFIEAVEEWQGAVSEQEKAELAEKAAQAYAHQSKMAYRFTADSVCMPDADGTNYTCGTYTLDADKQEVTCMMDYSKIYTAGYIHKTVFRIRGGRLVTHQVWKNTGKTDIQEYERKE